MRKLTLAAMAALTITAGAQAQDQTLKMATIAPSLGAAISMATIANVVTDNLDGVSIEVARWRRRHLAHDGSGAGQPGFLHDQPGGL